MEKCAFLVVHESISEDGNYSKETIIMLICLNDLFARLGLTRTCKLLTKLSKNSFYLLPDSLRLGDFFYELSSSITSLYRFSICLQNQLFLGN